MTDIDQAPQRAKDEVSAHLAAHPEDPVAISSSNPLSLAGISERGSNEGHPM